MRYIVALAILLMIGSWLVSGLMSISTHNWMMIALAASPFVLLALYAKHDERRTKQARVAAWDAKLALDIENRRIAEEEQHRLKQQEWVQREDTLYALRNRRNDLVHALKEAGDACIFSHLHTLRKKRTQLLRQDDYGMTVGLDRWASELEYFVDNVAFGDASYSKLLTEYLDIEREILSIAYPSQSDAELDLQKALRLGEETTRFKEAIDHYVESSSSEESATLEATIESMSGDEYEAFCKVLLSQGNWDVVHKGGTGDQGVDLLARKNGLVVAIQCKRYASSVGNKAVQEVEAGRAFERAAHAAVVSTADYTPSARQLAASLGVLLLHHSDLSRLDSLVGAAESA